MKKFVTLLLVSLFASVAFAGIDPGTDSFGVYFDTAGNTNTYATGPFTPFNAYLILANPAGPTNGFECTVTPSGAAFFALSTTLGGAGALDVDSSTNGFAVGAASDYPIVNGGIVLVTWQMMVTAPAPALEFRINKATIPSMTGGLPVVTGNGILRRCGISSGSVTAPVAYVNSPSQPVPAEVSSFGTVKSLFR